MRIGYFSPRMEVKYELDWLYVGCVNVNVGFQRLVWQSLKSKLSLKHQMVLGCYVQDPIQKLNTYVASMKSNCAEGAARAKHNPKEGPRFRTFVYAAQIKLAVNLQLIMFFQCSMNERRLFLNLEEIHRHVWTLPKTQQVLNHEVVRQGEKLVLTILKMFQTWAQLSKPTPEFEDTFRSSIDQLARSSLSVWKNVAEMKLLCLLESSSSRPHAIAQGSLAEVNSQIGMWKVLTTKAQKMSDSYWKQIYEIEHQVCELNFRLS